MRRRLTTRLLVAALSLPVALLGAHSAAGATLPAEGLLPSAPVDPWLKKLLASAAGQVTVQVHGDDIGSARTAVRHAGLQPLFEFDRFGVAVASGSARQIALVARQPGVTYVEGDRPIEYHLDHSHRATRGSIADARWAKRSGARLDGRGVSVAVIDTGVDPTHPFFRDVNGDSVVVANLKNACGFVSSDPDFCFYDVGPAVDTDTLSAGGHGTHVMGIVAGQPTKLSNGARLRGAAPGAKIVGLSVGLRTSIIHAEMALQWVLEHHKAPCGARVSPQVCPPIKVVNNSYGPSGGGEFNPTLTVVKMQRALAAAGVVTVWAAGNAKGDGTKSKTNPWGQDPTPGVISVASYYDLDTGSRAGKVSSYSSRGQADTPFTWPDISAPGEKITSSCRLYLTICSGGLKLESADGATGVGAFSTISGTSMAAPHISGIVAQLFQARPHATPRQIERALKAGAYRYSDGARYRKVRGYQTSYDKGTGLVDVVKALSVLRAIPAGRG